MGDLYFTPMANTQTTVQPKVKSQLKSGVCALCVKNFCVRPDHEDDTWFDGESSPASTWLPVEGCNVEEVGSDEGAPVKIKPSPKKKPKKPEGKPVKTGRDITGIAEAKAR